MFLYLQIIMYLYHLPSGSCTELHNMQLGAYVIDRSNAINRNADVTISNITQ